MRSLKRQSDPKLTSRPTLRCSAGVPRASRPRPTSYVARAREAAFRSTDIGPLVWFRITFGCLMLIEVFRFFQHGWISRYYVAPTHLFKYFGFDWVHPWPGVGMQIHFLLLGVLAGCITLGWCYRAASWLFFFGFTYVFLLEQARYLNHFYLVCLYALLLAVVPAHRAFSMDAARHRELRTTLVPVWTLWLLRAQILIVYFFGGVAKLNSDWLQGEPMRLWLAKRAEFPLIGPFVSQEWLIYFFSYGGLLFDLGIVPLLLIRKTRWLAFALAAGFNLTNAWLFQIGIFPWFALGATVLLFSERLPLPRQIDPPRPSQTQPAPLWMQHVTLGLLGAYLVLQCTVPLRHWFYPGDVQWTEEGHRFSWRMKLRDKNARMNIYAHDPRSNQTWKVDISRYVNRLQSDEAAGRPDMILQLCHQVAASFRRDGHPDIQIRAHVWVSLNGRPEQRLIDPDVDLAAERRTLRHVQWILPLETPLAVRAAQTSRAN